MTACKSFLTDAEVLRSPQNAYLLRVLAVIEDSVEVDSLELDVAQERPHGKPRALQNIILADLQQLTVAGNAANACLQSQHTVFLLVSSAIWAVPPRCA